MTLLAIASKDLTSFANTAPATARPAARTAAPATVSETKPRRGFWSAIFNAIWVARQRQADLEIARYLASTGGKLTDSSEREISRRLGNDNFRLR